MFKDIHVVCFIKGNLNREEGDDQVTAPSFSEILCYLLTLKGIIVKIRRINSRLYIK